MEMLFEYRSKLEVGILQRDGDWAFIVLDTSWSLGMSLFLKCMEEVLKVKCGVSNKKMRDGRSLVRNG